MSDDTSDNYKIKEKQEYENKRLGYEHPDLEKRDVKVRFPYPYQ